MSASLVIQTEAPFEDRWSAAVDEYSGKIRTFARNSYYKMPGYDVEDVEQELMVVLWECLMHYDPSKKVKFNTYFQQSAKNKIITLIRYFEAKRRATNVGTVSLSEEAVQWAVEERLAFHTAEDIALQRMELREVVERNGYDILFQPQRGRRRTVR